MIKKRQLAELNDLSTSIQKWVIANQSIRIGMKTYGYLYDLKMLQKQIEQQEIIAYKKN